jgi:hypothetical protein
LHREIGDGLFSRHSAEGVQEVRRELVGKKPALQERASLQIRGQRSDLTQVREVGHTETSKVSGEKDLLLLAGSELGVGSKLTKLKHKLTKALNVGTKSVRGSNACVKVKFVCKNPQRHGKDWLLDRAGEMGGQHALELGMKGNGLIQSLEDRSRVKCKLAKVSLSSRILFLSFTNTAFICETSSTWCIHCHASPAGMRRPLPDRLINIYVIFIKPPSLKRHVDT